MKINIIAAVGKNLELGANNKLIWKIPEDLKYFKEKTKNKTVVMGDKTFYSIGKLLPERNNIILSLDNIKIEGALTLNDYKDVFSLNCDEIFIIGGEKVYSLFLPFADNIYLTEIDDEKYADCYFPSFNKKLYNKKIIREGFYDNLKYKFTLYEKIK